MLQQVVKWVTGIINLRGATDNTLIGNTSDRLRVESQFKHNAVDAFGRLRTSEPRSLFESFFSIDKQPLLWSESLTGAATATFNANKDSVDFITTTASGDKTIFQSRRYILYHPGKSQLVMISGNLGGLKANCRRRIGTFHANDGVFFELDGTQPRVVIRSSISGSVVDTQVNQDSWNIDKLDGTGVSGITLDWSKQQLFILDYQWLGSGSIRFGFSLGGNIVYVHQQNNANNLSVPWAKIPTAPIRLEIENTGVTASSTTMHLTCTAVTSEGGYTATGILRTTSTQITPRSLATAGTVLPIISLRKSASYINRVINLIDIGIFAASSDDFLVQIIKNGTLTSASWTALPGIGERDVSATAITGGQVIYSFYVRGSAYQGSSSLTEIFEKSSNTALGSDLAGTSEIISVVMTNISPNASAYGFMNYKEFV